MEVRNDVQQPSVYPGASGPFFATCVAHESRSVCIIVDLALGRWPYIACTATNYPAGSNATEYNFIRPQASC